MFQEQNVLLLVEELRKRPGHVRALATRTDTAPATALRALKQLRERNVVDYTREGRNTVYHLKDTPEATQYIHITEHAKLLKALENPALRRLHKELTKITSTELILVFGSHAKNTQTPQSDIDVYIETANEELKRRAQQTSKKISVHTGPLHANTPLKKEIATHHIVLQNTERCHELLPPATRS